MSIGLFRIDRYELVVLAHLQCGQIGSQAVADAVLIIVREEGEEVGLSTLTGRWYSEPLVKKSSKCGIFRMFLSSDSKYHHGNPFANKGRNTFES